jgi:hypothetical protein
VKKGKSTNKEDKEDSSEDDYDAWEVVSTPPEEGERIWT